MASVREQVLQAVFDMVGAARPNAKLLRNAKKPTSIDPGGTIIVHDGEPGEPDVTLSPLTYTYSHQVHIDVAAYESATKAREQVLDEILADLGAAVEADRSLGGLCQWVEFAAPAADDYGDGTEPFRFVQLALTCIYDTSNPLG